MTDSLGTQAPATLDEQTIRGLRTELQGTLLQPVDAEYDAARAIWNGMIDKRPALIARCVSTEDVVHAVNFARNHNLLIAVRGGGHNAAGKALCDDGLVIDLSPMRTVDVDPTSRTAHVGGGATWADLDQAAHAHHLATTGGAISTTGVAGLTLGGGLGWLMRSYGMACDNLIGAEVVTASGEVVHANASENADLLWGLRGGGGNFGIVTDFEFQLHPVDTVVSGMVVHPYERAREALQFLRDFGQQAPDALALFCAIMTTPDGARVVAFLICYNGPQDASEAILEPLVSWGPPLMAQIGEVPYPQHQQMLDQDFPAGLQVYWRSEFLRGLDDEVIDSIIEQFDQVTSPLSALVIEQFGGAVRRIPKEDTAFVHRDADFNLAIISRWEQPGEGDEHIAWARNVHSAMRPYSTGVYVNYLGEEGTDRIKAAYGEEVYQRLVALKTQYDPSNLFRLNQNIPPAGAS